jgi:hypothetical protein
LERHYRVVIYDHNMFIIQATGLLIICSCDQLKHYNSQGSMDVSILPEVSKDVKLKVWFFHILEICGLTRNWCQTGTLLEKLSGLLIGAGEGAKTGVLSRETKWSKKWVGRFGVSAHF